MGVALPCKHAVPVHLPSALSSPCPARSQACTARSRLASTSGITLRPALPACTHIGLACPSLPASTPRPTPCTTQIEKKPYYHVFRLAGFVGFDGDFK